MERHPVFALIGGGFALIIAMGIGRFAYTPLLPLMQNDVEFSNAVAGYLASSNYAGYFLGAMLAGMTSRRSRAVFLKLGIIFSILTTAFMGLYPSYWLWFIWRFLSGMASAFVFVLATGIVMDQLASRGKMNWSGIFYGGVGLGICYTGLIVPLLQHSYGWKGAWMGLAATGVVLFLFVWFLLRDERTTSEPSMTQDSLVKLKLPSKKWLPWLIAAYGCEGLGYIVTGTFIVSFADRLPEFYGDATRVWIWVGVAAIPSCMLWSMLGGKIGWVRSLGLAMVLQSIGMVVPVYWSSPMGFTVGALLFGATFMGITTLATMLARQISPSNSSKVIGILTSFYALGQMIGPSAAGILSSVTQSYHEVLIGAAGVVAVGASLLWVGLQFEKKAVRLTSTDYL
ncbi:YbfB/YjiJ family MFS transporter [Ammoniphilus sp. CFH 90114]|uniref:YbfB/YjiJ family MFS transporter n=1 Tax=Ammoniphilus sp. CFH 90114 TaxID=2493665 RepID=UPI00100E9FF3|nr:YbfB/YjiJ family MFS transporter [Ammoniphilus sp. CFH 90114]RXT07983.1 YbfB/YjiJ family MFS transporter [Ammoniphilus sp. CFH 90114]